MIASPQTLSETGPIKDQHLSSYCSIFSSHQHLVKFATREILESKKKSDRALALAKWTNFSTFCGAITHEISSLKGEDLINIFLDGLCTASIVQFFSNRQTSSPVESVPFPLAEPVFQSGVTFYPINPHDPQLVEKTSKLRNCMAAYRVSVAFKQKFSSEYIPIKILEKLNLKITGSYPPREIEQEGYPAYCMEDLLQVATRLESQNKESNYLVCVSKEGSSHSIGLGLQEPYHLFDPAFGLAIIGNREAFFLFLASYLTNKYPGYGYFNILEFSNS